jgi:hypothetical protein
LNVFGTRIAGLIHWIEQKRREGVGSENRNYSRINGCSLQRSMRNRIDITQHFGCVIVLYPGHSMFLHGRPSLPASRCCFPVPSHASPTNTSKTRQPSRLFFYNTTFCGVPPTNASTFFLTVSRVPLIVFELNQAIWGDKIRLGIV